MIKNVINTYTISAAIRSIITTALLELMTDDSESTNVNTIPPDVIPLTKDANTPLVLPITLVALSFASETNSSDCLLPKSSSPVITAPIA